MGNIWQYTQYTIQLFMLIYENDFFFNYKITDIYLGAIIEKYNICIGYFFLENRTFECYYDLIVHGIMRWIFI